MLNIYDYLAVEDFPQEDQLCHKPKRGRPPLTIDNPLDSVPTAKYMNSDGFPHVWLDDCLIGAIRAFGERDTRKSTTANYVSLNKVFKTLVNLKGKLTPKRVAKSLGVNHDTGWRIVSVIKFATFSIERELLNTKRVISYGLPPIRR